MKTLDAIHQNHTQLSSEAVFLKKEIDFLLNILKNCYSASVNDDRIKLLDSYWKSFDQNLIDLDQLLTRVQLEEKKITSWYKNQPMNSIFPETKGNDFNLSLSSIEFKIKTLKESFYEFMHGCSACAFKTK
jgi:hypothetical protein